MPGCSWLPTNHGAFLTLDKLGACRVSCQALGCAQNGLHCCTSNNATEAKRGWRKVSTRKAYSTLQCSAGLNQLVPMVHADNGACRHVSGTSCACCNCCDILHQLQSTEEEDLQQGHHNKQNVGMTQQCSGPSQHAIPLYYKLYRYIM